MHYLNPRLDRSHVVFFYRNFQKLAQACHIGLGVNALHSVKMLRAQKIRADAAGVGTVEDVSAYLSVSPSITHAVIEAPWIGTQALEALMSAFPHVHFIVRTHSEVGFLQADPGAVQLIREQILLAEGSVNFSVAANSQRLTDCLRAVYDARVLCLPNLYDLQRTSRKRDERHEHGVVNIGSFGALRPQKNHASAAAAALMIARERQVRLVFFMNVNRNEGGGPVLEAVRGFFKGLPWAELREVPWCSWPEFRRVVAHMDLVLAPSSTESFMLTTADAVAEGVPAVVSHSIAWAPESWKVGGDDLEGIARIGSSLLSSRTGAAEGLRALEAYMEKALGTWTSYLAGPPEGRA